MNQVKVIFPISAETPEQKLQWASEELGRLYIERESLWSKNRATEDYSKILYECQTAKARVAELLRGRDEIIFYLNDQIKRTQESYLQVAAENENWDYGCGMIEGLNRIKSKLNEKN